MKYRQKMINTSKIFTLKANLLKKLTTSSHSLSIISTYSIIMLSTIIFKPISTLILMITKLSKINHLNILSKLSILEMSNSLKLLNIPQLLNFLIRTKKSAKFSILLII